MTHDHAMESTPPFHEETAQSLVSEGCPGENALVMQQSRGCHPVMCEARVYLSLRESTPREPMATLYDAPTSVIWYCKQKIKLIV